MRQPWQTGLSTSCARNSGSRLRSSFFRVSYRADTEPDASHVAHSFHLLEVRGTERRTRHEKDHRACGSGRTIGARAGAICVRRGQDPGPAETAAQGRLVHDMSLRADLSTLVPVRREPRIPSRGSRHWLCAVCIARAQRGDGALAGSAAISPLRSSRPASSIPPRVSSRVP